MSFITRAARVLLPPCLGLTGAASKTGMQRVYIPCRGGGQAMRDLVVGQIPAVHAAVAGLHPFVKNGQIKSELAKYAAPAKAANIRVDSHAHRHPPVLPFAGETRRLT